MLKAIHAGEDLVVARQQAIRVIEKLRGLRLTRSVMRHSFDASLLFRCMDRLQIDRSDLANADPLLFRELQGVCALCRSKHKCFEDLAREFDDPQWDKWWPIAPIPQCSRGAVQNCGGAARHLKMRYSSVLPHLR